MASREHALAGLFRWRCGSTPPPFATSTGANCAWSSSIVCGPSLGRSTLGGVPCCDRRRLRHAPRSTRACSPKTSATPGDCSGATPGSRSSRCHDRPWGWYDVRGLQRLEIAAPRRAPLRERGPDCHRLGEQPAPGIRSRFHDRTRGLLDWREQSRLVEAFAAFTLRRFELTGKRRAGVAQRASVTGNFFHVMGTRAAVGRQLRRRTSRTDVRKSATASGSVGSPGCRPYSETASSSTHSSHRVGVLPPTSISGCRDRRWISLQPGPDERAQRSGFWLGSVARLRPGTTVAQAQMRWTPWLGASRARTLPIETSASRWWDARTT